MCVSDVLYFYYLIDLGKPVCLNMFIVTAWLLKSLIFLARRCATLFCLCVCVCACLCACVREQIGCAVIMGFSLFSSPSLTLPPLLGDSWLKRCWWLWEVNFRLLYISINFGGPLPGCRWEQGYQRLIFGGLRSSFPLGCRDGALETDSW